MDGLGGDAGTVAGIAAAVGLAAVPLTWLLRHDGARPHGARADGDDDLPFLAALLFAGFALVLAGAAVVRLGWERHKRAAWRPVTVAMDACTVLEASAGVLGGTRVLELSCNVRFEVGGQPYARTVTAGYPTNRARYDGWIVAHPVGSRIALRYPPGDPASVYGLADAVRGATTARDSAGRALLFGGIAGALFAVSRVRARRRERWLEDW